MQRPFRCTPDKSWATQWMHQGTMIKWQQLMDAGPAPGNPATTWVQAKLTLMLAYLNSPSQVTQRFQYNQKIGLVRELAAHQLSEDHVADKLVSDMLSRLGALRPPSHPTSVVA